MCIQLVALAARCIDQASLIVDMALGRYAGMLAWRMWAPLFGVSVYIHWCRIISKGLVCRENSHQCS